MSNKSKREKGGFTRHIIIGAFIGGGIGAAIGLIGTMGKFVSSRDGVIALAILGASVGIAVGILNALSAGDKITEDKLYDNNKPPLRKALKNFSDSARLQLREEQLEISKELVQVADVTSHKEVITEEKIITVPVTREELVVEKRSLDNNDSDTESKSSEIMRIPLEKEQVRVVKSPIKLEDVSIYRNKYQETKHIEETLKKETVNIDTAGNVKVVDKDNEEN